MHLRVHVLQVLQPRGVDQQLAVDGLWEGDGQCVRVVDREADDDACTRRGAFAAWWWCGSALGAAVKRGVSKLLHADRWGQLAAGSWQLAERQHNKLMQHRT